METMDMWHQVGFLADAFACFREHGLSVMDDGAPDHPGLPGGRQAA
jgi:hypothetical protein